MAEQIVSPGVFTRENDQSFIQPAPVQAGAALVGPTVKGAPYVPTLVTSYSDYQNKFGTTFTSGGMQYSFLTSIAAYNYFNEGGETLLVTRVVSGGFSNFTAATSTPISNSDDNTAFVLKTISKGIVQNSTSSEDINGALESGSKDNVRWEISQASTGSGTFTLLIRRGNDTTNEKTVLETYANISLDPFSDNYISKIIGDQVLTLQGSGASSYLQMSGSYPNKSSYVYVSSVNTPTPNYFDNSGIPKTQFTSSIPIIASGTFENAAGNIISTIAGGDKYYQYITSTNSQGLVASDYTDALALLANKDEFQYNVISLPGMINAAAGHTAAITTLITNTQNRGDAIAVIDPVLYGSTVQGAVAAAGTRNTSYAAMYWPWCQVIDPDSGQAVWVPASTLIPGVYAFNDKIAAPWFAPAGLNRGTLSSVIRAERKLPNADRDTLYQGKVNPIATFPNSGVVVFGQKTLQTRATALDRVNVRRLLIALKSFISQVANNLVFDQNTIATRNSFLSQVNPYLESVQQRQGLFAFKVVMDDTNNTGDVIDRNQLVGQIFIQPARTAEFVILDFNILPTGAEFPA
jgi:hypothetical protein